MRVLKRAGLFKIGALAALLVGCGKSVVAPVVAFAGDVTAPVVSLAADPAVVYGLGEVATVAANATDNVGVGKVEFYRVLVAGANPVATLLYTDTAAPYQLTFVFSRSGQNGTYVYLVKAYDAAGNVATSNTAKYTVSIEQNCTLDCSTIVLGATPDVLSVPGTVVLNAETTNTFKVEFYRDAGGVRTLLYTDTTLPFALPLAFSSSSQNGTYKYYAKAYKGDGTFSPATASFVVSIP